MHACKITQITMMRDRCYSTAQNNAHARTFCLPQEEVQLIAGRLSLSPGNCKNFFVVGSSNCKNFFVVLCSDTLKGRVCVSENVKWSERHSQVSAKNIIILLSRVTFIGQYIRDLSFLPCVRCKMFNTGFTAAGILYLANDHVRENTEIFCVLVMLTVFK